MIPDRATIDETTYRVLRARYDAYHAARERVCGPSNCVTSEQAALLPTSLSHEELSAIEVYGFVQNPPDHYMAYIAEASREDGGYREAAVAAWPGELLGWATLGRPYRNNMGDARHSVTLWARNGWVYSGVYYQSAGDYCRLRRTKERHGVTDPTLWPVGRPAVRA